MQTHLLWDFVSAFSGTGLHKNISVNVGVPQGSILGPTPSLLYINNLPGNVFCDIAIYADDTTLLSKCDKTSDMLQQLELASKLESDLWDTRLEEGVACWFDCWKNSTGFVWLV